MKSELRVVVLLWVCLVAGSSRLQADWRLVWNDEFSGTAVDPAHWAYDLGTGPPYPGWGNNELEYYTSRPENVHVTNGALHLVARREAYGGANYTSARLKSYGRFSQAYGRFEFRARLPQGRGYWPALWLMPRDSVYGGWAASGEIDAMENRGHEPTTVSGTLHYGGEWPDNTRSSGPSFTFPAGGSITNFHVYALDWRTNFFRWYVDGQLYQTQTSWWSSGGPFPAPFDQPFYIIMNLAVGGNFVGSPDATTVFPGELQLDYVRVYEYTTAAVPRLQFTSVDWVVDRLALGGSNGPPNATYYLLGTSNAAAQLSLWTRLATNQFDGAGGFTNRVTHGSSSAFYRLEVP